MEKKNFSEFITIIEHVDRTESFRNDVFFDKMDLEINGSTNKIW